MRNFLFSGQHPPASLFKDNQWQEFWKISGRNYFDYFAGKDSLMTLEECCQMMHFGEIQDDLCLKDDSGLLLLFASLAFGQVEDTDGDGKISWEQFVKDILQIELGS